MATGATTAATAVTAKKSFSAWYAGHKPEAFLGAAGIVVAFALYEKSKKSSSGSSGTPATSTLLPGTLPPDTANLGGGDLAGIDSILQQLSGQVAALQPTGSPAAGGPPGSAPAPPSSLPPVDANAFPEIVKFGDYAPGDYTKIGTVTAGQFHGTNVGGGVPVYAGEFGGFAQGFNEATLPSGTDLYIPSQFTGYETTKS